MSAKQVKELNTATTAAGEVSVGRTEWIVDSAADLAGLPPVGPGSVAYKADGSYIAIYDGTNWVQWTGGEAEGE